MFISKLPNLDEIGYEHFIEICQYLSCVLKVAINHYTWFLYVHYIT